MKDKTINLLLIAAGVYFIYKYMNKSATNVIKTPVEPTTPVMETGTISVNSILQPILADVHYQAEQYNEYTPDTFQTYYGKTVSGVKKTISGVPMTC